MNTRIKGIFAAAAAAAVIALPIVGNSHRFLTPDIISCGVTPDGEYVLKTKHTGIRKAYGDEGIRTYAYVDPKGEEPDRDVCRDIKGRDITFDPDLGSQYSRAIEAAIRDKLLGKDNVEYYIGGPDGRWVLSFDGPPSRPYP